MGPRPVAVTRNTAGLVWGPREPATPQPPRATDAARAMCQWRCHSRLGPRGRPRGWTRGASRWLAVAAVLRHQEPMPLGEEEMWQRMHSWRACATRDDCSALPTDPAWFRPVVLAQRLTLLEVRTGTLQERAHRKLPEGPLHTFCLK